MNPVQNKKLLRKYKAATPKKILISLQPLPPLPRSQSELFPRVSGPFPQQGRGGGAGERLGRVGRVSILEAISIRTIRDIRGLKNKFLKKNSFIILVVALATFQFRKASCFARPTAFFL